jgi:hypothetical protein
MVSTGRSLWSEHRFATNGDAAVVPVAVVAVTGVELAVLAKLSPPEMRASYRRATMRGQLLDRLSSLQSTWQFV